MEAALLDPGTLETVGEETGLKAYGTESRRVLKLAGPICLQSALAFSSNLMSLGFAGHLGKLALSQAVLGLSAYNITGFSLLLGLATGLETLCGQAYGARNFAMLGVFLQRGVLICSLAFCAILLIWTQVLKALLYAGQDEVIATGSVYYMWRLAPGLWCFTMNECLKRYLMAENIVIPGTVSMAVAAALAPLYNWALVFRFGWGLGGAALASSAVQATALLLLLGYILWRDASRRHSPQKTWNGWSAKSFQGWWPYLKLALPCMLACALEWWLYEGLILIAGILENAQVAVAVMGIGFNTTALTYCVSLGVAGAASTRVANELGAGRPSFARRAAHTVFWLEMALMLVIFGAGMAVRPQWAAVFTNDPQVASAVVAVLPIILLSELGDGANGVCGGVMRGAGRQALASILNAVSYWGIGLPISVLLALHLRLGVRGLWLGLLITTSLQGLAMYGTVCCFDWTAEAKRAARTASESAPESADHAETIKMPPVLSRPTSPIMNQPDYSVHRGSHAYVPDEDLV